MGNENGERSEWVDYRGRAQFAVCLLALGAMGPSSVATAADPNKILRLASPDIETFDPQQFTDNPSYEVFTANSAR